jgi:hypothetical protein
MRRALTAGVHEGVLKGSGRMIVGSVSTEVYGRIEEYARKGASASDPSKPEIAAVTTKPVSEQNTNTGAGAISPAAAPPTVAAPASSKADSATGRETLRVGARVLAVYWNEKREFDGFWLATVKRVDHGEFTLDRTTTSIRSSISSTKRSVRMSSAEILG